MLLGWMSGYTRQNRIRIRHTIIRQKIGVAPIVEKIAETCLK